MNKPIDLNKRYTKEECDSANHQYKIIMANDILGRIEILEKGKVEDCDYKEHKAKCSRSFEDVFLRFDKLERAMFGEPELENKGVLEMTREMYNSVMLANGAKSAFWMSAKIASAFLAIGGGIWGLVELIKKLIKLE